MNQKINLEILKNAIRNVPDFPKKGIQFKDITTLLKEPDLLAYVSDRFFEHFRDKGITKVVAVESRGFILGGDIARRLGAGFIPVRKPGKLPAGVFRQTYKLEYGEDAVEIHRDAMNRDDIVLLHDDLLATGGTSLAVIELIKNFDVRKIFPGYIIELDFLEGRKKIANYDIFTLIRF